MTVERLGPGRDDVGSVTMSGVAGVLDSDTNVGTGGQSRGAVGPITSHGTKVAETLEVLNDLVLVPGEDTSEMIGEGRKHFHIGSNLFQLPYHQGIDPSLTPHHIPCSHFGDARQ